jgi:hypothetical protein
VAVADWMVLPPCNSSGQHQGWQEREVSVTSGWWLGGQGRSGRVLGGGLLLGPPGSRHRGHARAAACSKLPNSCVVLSV